MKLEIEIAFIVVFLATIFILVVQQQRSSRRKQKQPTISPCYLKTESKPQYDFRHVLADNSHSSFKHLKLIDSNDDSVLKLHPYKEKISYLLENPSLPFSFCDGEMDFELSKSFIWVDTETDLRVLVVALSSENVFAVDTEQHSLRSFLGFTALMQISTRSEDYLVDTIALHDTMSMLRPIFADPGICKVFHGADNDVLWLQRDFHIYVVNIFDTAKACEVLSKPQKSLAYLLEFYCGVATNKLLQLEDWRQRPLSIDMVAYARTDAHYLLYIAGRLIAELKQHDIENSSCHDEKLHSVMEACHLSNLICLQLYTKEIEFFPGSSATSSICSRHLSGPPGGSVRYIDDQFQENVRRLCLWRDLMARLHDESYKFVLSDQAIVAVAYKTPANQTEICDTIFHADQSANSLNSNVSLRSPSLVICSHLDDFYDLLRDKMSNFDTLFPMILQRHVGPDAGCPLSIYNHSLLSKSNLNPTTGYVPKKHVVNNGIQNNWKASRQQFVQKFSCKAPVYHNCRIYASDGRLLCYCCHKKIEWYVQRDLAKLVDEDPPAIMLLFEPKGHPEDDKDDNNFYTQSKKNICVGCGEGNHYLRYRVIPSCYRIHFPEHLKSHRSHDIVLLCVDCHEVAHSAAEKYKEQVAAEFCIPLFLQRVSDNNNNSQGHVISGHENGVSPVQLRASAMTLLRHGSKMPSRRYGELIQIVMRYYGGREISKEDLERALVAGMSPQEKRRVEKTGLHFKHGLMTSKPSDCDSSLKSDSAEESCNGGSVSLKHNLKFSLLGHGPHGKMVVDAVLEKYGEDGIGYFCQRWRKVFVNAIRPRFLPAGWDVMHSGRREFGEFSVYNPASARRN